MTEIRTQHADSESRHQLEALHHLAVELSGLRSVDSVLDTALRHCLELTDSQFGFIGMGGVHPEAMEIAAIHGFHPSPDFFQRHRLIPLRPNVFANAVLENRPVRSSDATVDPKRVGQPAGHPQVTTFLGVPLRLNDEPIGMIGVANRPDPYTNDHERLLLTYAGQVAIIIDNAQLYERLERANEDLERTIEERTAQLRDTGAELERKAAELGRVLTETVDAQELERERIARDLHDGINQLLIGAMLELTSGRRRVERGAVDESLTAFESAQEILRTVEAEIRRVVHGLHPQVLQGLGLVAATRRLVDEFAGQSGIECEVSISGDLNHLPPRIEVCAYRILQESIHNVATHAHATSVAVQIGGDGSSVTMEIADNGRGFEPERISSSLNGHFGLRSMRQRAEMLNGSLQIDSAIGEGTRIRVELPVDPP
jgi:signal transduction histidine kinase